MSAKVSAAALLLCLASSASAFAQNSRLTFRAIGSGALGSDVASTALIGGGLTIEPTDVLQLFAEANIEVGHFYPADTQDPPSNGQSAGPYVIVITNQPLGIPKRINATYVGGLRLITPPERTVRAFVDVGTGLAKYKGTTTSYPGNLPVGYYTENRGIWAAGGGLSKTLSARWVLDGEYRWCHPWSELAGPPFHRVQVSLGFAM